MLARYFTFKYINIRDEQFNRKTNVFQFHLHSIKLENQDVFEWVNDDGQKTVSCKWALHKRYLPDGSKKLKTRLMARGFEDRLADKRIDSATSTSSSNSNSLN